MRLKRDPRDVHYVTSYVNWEIYSSLCSDNRALDIRVRLANTKISTVKDAVRLLIQHLPEKAWQFLIEYFPETVHDVLKELNKTYDGGVSAVLYKQSLMIPGIGWKFKTEDLARDLAKSILDKDKAVMIVKQNTEDKDGYPWYVLFRDS